MKNDFSLFETIDTGNLLKNLINLEVQEVLYPENARYAIFDAILSLFDSMSDILIYIEDFEKIEATSKIMT